MEEETSERPSKRQKLDTPIPVSDEDSDSDDETPVHFYRGWNKELMVPDWAVKYRTAIGMYLQASHYSDVTTHGTFQHLCQITGYDFDKSQRKVLFAICRELVATKRRQFSKKLKGRPALWYVEGAAKRQKMRERMAYLQKKRLRKERKKKKQPVPIVKDYSDDEYVQELYNGYISEDEDNEVEYFYPALGELTDCEMLENSPLPPDKGRVSEETNLARMIRDTYKIDVVVLRQEIRKKTVVLNDVERFHQFIARARRTCKGQKISTAQFHREDAKLDKETLETYISDSQWRTPTNARLSFLDHFNRDWGLAKAYSHNTNQPQPHEIQPTPVYLVDPAMRTFAETKLRAKAMWRTMANEGTDPFEKRTYYLSDPLTILLKQRLGRHSDVIGRLFKHFYNHQTRDGIALRGEEFRINSRTVQRVFFNKQKGDYISWSDASKFLWENHYTLLPGRPLRPVDPIFYPDITHKEYIARDGPRRNQVGSNEIMTFYSCGSTSRAWHRPFPETLTRDVPTFADSYYKPRAIVRWLGKEMLTHLPTVGKILKYKPEEKAQFMEEYDRMSKEELETGKLWRVKNKQLPAQITTADYNGFEVSWYAMWRRPWIRNLEFSVDEIKQELHNLHEISKRQEDKFVVESGMSKRIPSRYLESEFLPGQHRKTFSKYSYRFVPPSFCTSYPENEHRESPEVDPVHAYDQGIFGPSGSKLDVEKPRSEPLNLTFSRHLQMGPDKKKQLEEYDFDMLYMAHRRRHKQVKRDCHTQYYLCYSEDEEDWLGYESEFDERLSLPFRNRMSRQRMEREKIERDMRRKLEGRDTVEDEKQKEPLVEEVESSEEESSEDEPVNLDSDVNGPTITELDSDVNGPTITELESSDDDDEDDDDENDEGDVIQVVDGDPTVEGGTYEPLEEYEASDEDEDEDEEHFYEDEDSEDEDDESSVEDDGPTIEEIE